MKEGMRVLHALCSTWPMGPNADVLVSYKVVAKLINLAEFERRAQRVAAKAVGNTWALVPSEVEKMYWKEMASGEWTVVEYGDNLERSAFYSAPEDPLGSSDWNLSV